MEYRLLLENNDSQLVFKIRQERSSVMASKVRPKRDAQHEGHVALSGKVVKILHSKHNIIFLKTCRAVADDIKIFQLQGNGIMVGILDTGVDYRNPLFRNIDGSTRIAGIWDQTIQDGALPDG